MDCSRVWTSCKAGSLDDHFVFPERKGSFVEVRNWEAYRLTDRFSDRKGSFVEVRDVGAYSSADGFSTEKVLWGSPKSKGVRTVFEADLG